MFGGIAETAVDEKEAMATLHGRSGLGREIDNRNSHAIAEASESPNGSTPVTNDAAISEYLEENKSP